MISAGTQENSESLMMRDLYKLADAGASVIQIRTREPVRTALTLRKNILLSDESEYREWDTTNGFRSFTKEDYVNHAKDGQKESFVDAVEEPLKELRNMSSSVRAFPNKIHYYAFVNPQPYMANNPYVTELMQQYAAILPTTNVVILLITPEVPLDSIPPGTILVAEMNTPSAEELEAQLRTIIGKAEEDFDEGSALTDDDIRKLSYLGLGLSLYEFETYAAIAIIDGSTEGDTAITMERMVKGLSEGKTAVVRQSDILELSPSAKMSEVGGMARLKDWVRSRANCYSDEAKEYGIEPPKGIVLAGVPGAGKSLAAKAISSELGVPLVKFDVSRVFSKYVGDSEQRIRSALKMVEGMAPCVLFIDEIDKGLGGTESGGDSGTSSRVLGSFLTWLQECKAPVFTMVTANRVSGLPPELLRRGRFDQIFSVALPTDLERIEVLDIHLKKRNKVLKFTAEETFAFTTATKDYVPAEIESCVKDALIAAFNAKETLGMRHILAAAKDMVPMSRSNKDNIERIVAWAKDNAIPVNYEANEERIGMAPSTRRMVSRTRGGSAPA